MVWLVVFVVLLLLAVFSHRIMYLGSDVHRMPGPIPFPLLGSALSTLMITPEGVIPKIQQYQKEHGNIFLMWMGLIPVVNVITAEGAEAMLTCKRNLKKGRSYHMLEPWLGQGLLTSEGSHWFSHRRLITPTFHFSILTTFLGIFQEHAETLVNRLASAADKGQMVELKPFITKCTLDVICEAAMGLKMNAQGEASKESESFDKTEASDYIQSIFRISQLTVKRILNPLLRASFIFFRTKLGQAYRRHLATIHGFAYQVIKSRSTFAMEGEADSRLAFLDLLLRARDQNGEPLTQQDIREEVDTFMFEGHDTTSAALVWVLYLLGTHAEIQEEIYREIERVLPDSSSPITTAHLAQMKTMERTIKEALRLYPSVPNIVRTITEEIQIGGYQVPVGTSLIVHIYQLHRDPKVFPDPEKFDPDRFLPENTLNRHPFAYIPFSAGQRNCIGQKFAMLEEKAILTAILRAYQVSFVGEFNAKDIRSELILRPPSGLNFRLKHRYRLTKMNP